jgi:5-methyltetrahydrofolate--homocysteine methyltransferase
LKPRLVAQGVKARGTVVIGTVHGDLHDIGKSIVGLMLEGAGFTVVDLGTNVTTAAFVKAVADNKADILGMSALLTTTMLEMRHVIAGLQEAGLRGRVKVMVGGAPLTQGFAQEIGADGYGSNAAVAVDLAKRLVAPTTKQ